MELVCISCIQFPEVVKLALLNCPGLRTPQTLCSLLQVNPAVRHTVQHSRCQCSIRSSEGGALGSLQSLKSFATWLPRNGALV